MPSFTHPFKKEALELAKGAKILILGTFPSERSRQFGFFYGNKNNVFWKLLSEIAYADERLHQAGKEQKFDFCKEHHLVLYDVIESYRGEKHYSNDRDLCKNLDEYSYARETIGQIIALACDPRIFGTSRKAVMFYEKYIKAEGFPSITYLPSPSPSARGIDKKMRLEKWREELRELLQT